MEFDRGPNSILFGVGTVGGVMSSYTKVPRIDRDFIAPSVQLDHRGSVRATVDGNMRLGEFGAVRLNALRDRQKGWRDNDRKDTNAATLAMLFKLSERTTLRADIERSESENTIISNTMGDAVSLWDGTTVANQWGDSLPTEDPQFVPGVPGVRTMHPWGESVFPLWIAGQPDLGLQDWSAGYSSTGTFLPVAPDRSFYPASMQASWQPVPHPDTSRIPVLPDSGWNLSARDALSKPEFDVGTIWLEHRFTDKFEVSISGYRYQDDHRAQNYEGTAFFGTDLNVQLPNGEPNPNLGKRYGDFFASRQTQERTVSEARAQATYRFKSQIAEIPWEQIFTGSVGSQQIEWSARQYNAQIIDDNPDNWAQNMVWTRLYEDNPHAAVALPASIDGIPVAYAPLPFDWFDFDETYDLENAAIVSQTRLWDDRFNLLLGARHDTYDYDRLGFHSGDRSSHSASGESYSAGAIYYFGWLGVFANHATNFDPIGPGRAPKLDGSAHEAADGRGTDYGLRISTEDKNYYMTLSRYTSKSSGRITGSKIGLSRIWQLYYEASGLPVVPENIALNFDDTESLRVDGYEFEIVANPIKGLRLQAGFAKPDSQIVESMAGQRVYFAQNIASWDAAATGTTPEATELRTTLDNAQNLMDQNAAGQTKTGLVDYTANVFVHYTFAEGWLSGFSAGAGVAITGKQYVGNVLDQKRYMDRRTATTLSLAYKTELWDTPTRFAINVDNLFDDEDYIVSSYDGGWLSEGQPIRNGFFFPAPRTIRFTTSMTF